MVLLFFIHFMVAFGKHGLVKHFNTVGTPGVINEGLVDMVVLFKGTENFNIKPVKTVAWHENMVSSGYHGHYKILLGMHYV